MLAGGGLPTRLAGQTTPPRLRWLRASIGNTVRVIAVDEVDFLRSDDKYTRIAWCSDGEAVGALVRLPLKELAASLDPAQFVQVHRAVVDNLRAIDRALRGDNDTATILLKDRDEQLPVSRAHLHLFRQM